MPKLLYLVVHFIPRRRYNFIGKVVKMFLTNRIYVPENFAGQSEEIALNRLRQKYLNFKQTIPKLELNN